MCKAILHLNSHAIIIKVGGARELPNYDNITHEYSHCEHALQKREYIYRVSRGVSLERALRT